MLLSFTYYSAAGSIVKKCVFVSNVIPKIVERQNDQVLFQKMKY